MGRGRFHLDGADDGLLAPRVEPDPQNAVRAGLDILKDPDIGNQRATGVGNDVEAVHRQLAIDQDIENPAILPAAGFQARTVDRFHEVEFQFVGAGTLGGCYRRLRRCGHFDRAADPPSGR